MYVFIGSGIFSAYIVSLVYHVLRSIFFSLGLLSKFGLFINENKISLYSTTIDQHGVYLTFGIVPTAFLGCVEVVCSVFFSTNSLLHLIIICHYLQEKHLKEIVFKAMGQAISKTVAIVEILKVGHMLYKLWVLSLLSPLSLSHINLTIGELICKQRRIPRLHQDTSISSISLTDIWEPIEEGLLP